MFSTILSTQKKARYQYVLSRVITVVSIFGLAIVKVIQERAEAAAKEAEEKAEEMAIQQATAEGGSVFYTTRSTKHCCSNF